MFQCTWQFPIEQNYSNHGTNEFTIYPVDYNTHQANASKQFVIDREEEYTYTNEHI